MRCIPEGLLGAIALLASTTLGSTLAFTDSEATAVYPASSTQALPAHQTRYLRDDHAIDADQEERRADVKNFLKLDKLKNGAQAGMSKFATSVQVGKLRLQKQSGSEAFVRLGLDKVGADALISSPGFPVWVSFMAKIYHEHPKTTIVKNLAARYTDERLATMLATAKLAPGTEQIATKLQVAQVREWIRIDKSLDDVMALLKLNHGVDKLLTNPRLDTLEVFLRHSSKMKQQGQTPVINALRDYYGDDAVAKMLEAAIKAKKTPNTEALAKKLQNSQFDEWFKENAKPAAIWKMLNMEKATWMKNPDAAVFYGYRDFYKLQKAKATPVVAP